jgi:serine/threonine protein kinase
MAQSNEFDSQIREAFGAQYVLERELTGGGMSRVFLATERALNRQVVIKVLPPDLAAGVNRERFRREIQLAAQLQHPHIVPLYAAGEFGELLYYTMPFIEGESLKHALHGEHPQRFTPREVVRILHDVVDALAYAHERGVIHRDIKPGNVLRSGSHAVVTDFGVAKAISASMPSVGMTASGMVIGTPAYMAPEQLAGDPAADQRVDIYAVGLLAYELLTGSAPFDCPSPAETMAAQLTRAPSPIENVRSDVPPALRAVVMRCLAKNPADRPQQARALLAELDEMALPTGDYPPVKPPSTRGLLAVLGVLAATSVAIYAVRGRSATPTPPAVEPPKAVSESAAVTALTRADSLAIAAAIEAKFSERASAMTPQPKAVPDQQIMARLADSLRAEIQRAVLDSLKINNRPPRGRDFGPPPGAPPGGFDPSQGRRNGGGSAASIGLDSATRAAMAAAFTDRTVRSMQMLTRSAWDERAANLGPARRVVVADPSPDRRNPALADSGAVIMNRVRKALANTRGRFVVVSADSTKAALTKTRNPMGVAEALNADVVVSVRPTPIPGDSVIWTITLRDLTATSGFAERTTAIKLPAATSTARLDSLVGVSMRWLDQMDHSPRRGAEVRAAPSVAPAAPTPPSAPATTTTIQIKKPE